MPPRMLGPAGSTEPLGIGGAFAWCGIADSNGWSVGFTSNSQDLATDVQTAYILNDVRQYLQQLNGGLANQVPPNGYNQVDARTNQ